MCLCPAPQAAGIIHSDFEKGFICAEVIKFEDFIQYGSEDACKVILPHQPRFGFLIIHMFPFDLLHRRLAR